MVDKKLSSCAAYNQVSNQVFLRNLQVYFARATWSKNSAESEAITELYTQIVSQFSAQLYLGAQQHAMANNQPLV
ncbi:hypothetical protein AN214_01381 [Pseudoalteromonas sp. P1-9]|uniref:hypothetical protein n=1 Tax=Pseudoalteromonas sp. P1-9 TaxID=1710354 RepID=UPI0006D60DD1|nr:hypothetical protein [Pseudoalteromonas sp. P1-9]KPV96560.1 hypothetical protein AN214_01381 [Pseudoalteromonas sp. P1-9]